MGVRAKVLSGVLLIAALAAGSVYIYHRTDRTASDAVAVSQQVQAPAEPAETISEAVLERGATFADSLEDIGIDSVTVARITDVIRPVFDLRRLRAGNRFTVARSQNGELRSIRYQVDADNELWVTAAGQDFKAEMRTVPSTLRTTVMSAELAGSLFETVINAGEKPELAVRMAEIFAWDLDFYTDPQPGDKFRVLFEKREYPNGQPATYGRILIAEYNNAGKKYDAVLFEDAKGKPAYYNAEGKSLQKAFLKSPLKFAARVSSRFSPRRFHPVLKIYRPHLGTDYAAPTGTPVQSIAAGQVVFSGWSGGGGNTVRIRHAHGYESYYMHLSKRIVRVGQRVDQGQRIGLVGSTGLSSGPHLDFRLRRNGAFVNFEKILLPPAGPVPASQRAGFNAQRNQWMAIMEGASGQNVNASLPAPVTAAGQQ